MSLTKRIIDIRDAFRCYGCGAQAHIDADNRSWVPEESRLGGSVDDLMADQLLELDDVIEVGDIAITVDERMMTADLIVLSHRHEADCVAAR